MIRLQGEDFRKMRPELEMLGYQISWCGHIKAIMRKKGSQVHLGGSTRHLYSHYLNDEEEARFRNSEYFKTHEPASDELVYARHFKKMKKLKREAKQLHSIPTNLIEDMKKLKGLPPYDNKRLPNGEVVGTNYCDGDGFFANSLKEKYGQELYDFASKCVN